MKKFLLGYLPLAVIIVVGCNSGGGAGGGTTYKTTDSGFEYSFVIDEDGKTAKINDFLTMNMKYTTMSDSTLFSTFTNQKPLNFKFSETLFRGALNEGLQMMSAGDSANFLVSADKVYGERLPPFLKSGDKLKYIVKMIKVQDASEMQKEKDAASAAQRGKDESLITSYINGNNLKAQKTDKGLYYIIDNPGSGPNPKAGQTVKVHYTGTLLDGTKFDSSKDRGTPFEFPLGQGRVIQGWDQGIPLLKKGGSGKLIIPSTLGYGDRGAGAKIPPNSVLIFDVELLDFK